MLLLSTSSRCPSRCLSPTTISPCTCRAPNVRLWPSSLSADFAGACKEIDNWFNADPSHANEAISVQVKDEQDGTASSDSFRQQVREELQQHSRWDTVNKVLPLGQLRGKVQFLRRYNDSQVPFGIDMTDWPDNVDPNFTKTNVDGIKYTIQDHWQVNGASGWPGVRDIKISNMIDTFNLSIASTMKSQLFLNLASGTGAVPFMTPEMLAVGGSFTGINASLRKWLRNLQPQTARLGAILMDYPEDPEEDLVQAIIQTNKFGLSETLP